ncbi:retrovirus-related Pol polyprotein from transposon 297 [Trichonephila clavipes]|nr:retrovirus-related Pol polyprotein from transposon 297 [Trichonephila clavipes]
MNIPHTAIMSALDLRLGYFQKAVIPNDIVRTTNVTKNGTYAFHRLPFGLSGAAPNFQNTIDIILKPVIGLIINKEGIRTNETKVRAIVEMKPPRNSKEVSKFSGMSQKDAKFIKNNADLCESLYNFKQKLKKFCWSVEAQRAFGAVKVAITKAPVFKLPDFKKPFVLFMDASSIGVGAVLNQEQRPAVFASRRLSNAESERLGIRHLKTVVYRPQANRTERVYSDLVQMIANYVNDQHDTWDKFLRVFAYAIRTAVNETREKNPAELFLGRKLITPFQKLVIVSDGTEFAVGDIERLFEEARRNTKAKYEKWEKYNRRRHDVQIKVRIYRHRKCDETEIGTGSSDNGSLRDESSGFDRLQRRSNESQDGKKKGSEAVA